jgi:hypothetical protein
VFTLALLVGPAPGMGLSELVPSRKPARCSPVLLPEGFKVCPVRGVEWQWLLGAGESGPTPLTGWGYVTRRQ